jgi:hypothetical protein
MDRTAARRGDATPQFSAVRRFQRLTQARYARRFRAFSQVSMAYRRLAPSYLRLHGANQLAMREQVGELRSSLVEPLSRR